MCSFTQVIFLLSHMIFLNDTHRQSYNLSRNRLIKIISNIFKTKFCEKREHYFFILQKY